MLIPRATLEAIRAEFEPRLHAVGATFERFEVRSHLRVGPIQTMHVITAAKAIGENAVFIRAVFDGWSREYASSTFACEAALDPAWDAGTSVAEAMKLFEIELGRQAEHRDHAAAIGLARPIPYDGRGRIDHLRIDRDALHALSTHLAGRASAMEWLSEGIAALHGHYDLQMPSARFIRRIEVDRTTIMPLLVIAATGPRPEEWDDPDRLPLWCGNQIMFPDRLPASVIETLPGRRLGEVVDGLPFGHRIIASALTYDAEDGSKFGLGIALERDEVALIDVLDAIPAIPGTRNPDRMRR